MSYPLEGWIKSAARTAPVVGIYLWLTTAFASCQTKVFSEAAQELAVGVTTIFLAFLVSGEFARRSEVDRAEKNLGIQFCQEIEAKVATSLGGFLQHGPPSYVDVVASLKRIRQDYRALSAVVIELGLVEPARTQGIECQLAELGELLTGTPKPQQRGEAHNRVSDGVIHFGSVALQEGPGKVLALRLELLRLISLINRS